MCVHGRFSKIQSHIYIYKSKTKTPWVQKSGVAKKKQRPKRLISECGQDLYCNALWDILRPL